MKIEIKQADQNGDIFVIGTDKYINNGTSADSLQQLCINYHSAFGELPE